DVHEAAVREAENRDISHCFLRCGLSSERDATRAGPEDIVPRAKLGLRPPEGLISLAKSLFPRDADILQEVIVGAFSDLTQRAPLARARDPAGDRAAAADPAAALFSPAPRTASAAPSGRRRVRIVITGSGADCGAR